MTAHVEGARLASAAEAGDRAGAAGETSIVRGGLLLMLAKLVHVLAGFGLFFFLAEILQRSLGNEGTAAFGIYGTLLVIINPLNMMFAQGTLQLVSRTVASRPDLDPAAVFRACARVQLPFVLGILALFQCAAPFIAESYLNDASYTTGLRIGGAIPLFYAVRCLYQGYCNGTRRFREQSWVDMGSSILRMVLVLGGAAAGFGAIGALLGFVAAALIMMVVAMVWIRPAAGPRVEHIELRRLFSFQGQVLAITLGTFFLMSLDQLAVKALGHSDPAVTDRLAGYFTGNQKIAQIPWGIITALVWVLFPLMADGSADKQRQLATLRQGFRLVLLLLVPVCAILFSTADETYALVFASTARRAVQAGDPLSLVSGPLQVLSIGYLIFGLLSMATMLITAQGRAGTTLWIIATTLGLCHLATRALVVEFGPVGAAWGSAGSWTIGLVAALAVLARSHGAIVSGRSVLRILLAGGVVCVVAELVPGSGWMLLPRDALLGLVYVAAIVALRESTPAEWRGLVLAARGRRLS